MPFSYKPLWIKLVQEGMTKEELRIALGFSSATIANMGKDKYVSMESIDKICSYFNVQPNDIIEHVEEPPQE
ncbi:helix-turn-helix transcriptional regulator [Paenibacillus sp. FSL L8-0470]|uniref:helix-turn-helix domain-containing protein n=1 Tax=Paenibacillus sp. FSL L8-0470 TaxID=2954688 RepID=UPI0030F92E2D